MQAKLPIYDTMFLQNITLGGNRQSLAYQLLTKLSLNWTEFVIIDDDPKHWISTKKLYFKHDRKKPVRYQMGRMNFWINTEVVLYWWFFRIRNRKNKKMYVFCEKIKVLFAEIRLNLSFQICSKENLKVAVLLKGRLWKWVNSVMLSPINLKFELY